MDIVYPLIKTKDNNTELLFSLRSLSNISHGKVFIIGHKPEWVENVVHIPCDDPYSQKVCNAYHKIKKACLNDELSEDFILMNDDFYITEPTEIKYYHQGTIADHLERRRQMGHIKSRYCRSLQRAQDIFPQGLDYELHIPFIYNKKKFLALDFDLKNPPLLRSLYGNTYNVKGKQMEDVKYEYRDDIRIHGTFFSTDDRVLVFNDNFKYMKQLFNKPSPYENDKYFFTENGKVQVFFKKNVAPYKKGNVAFIPSHKAEYMEKHKWVDIVRNTSMADKPKIEKKPDYNKMTKPQLINLLKSLGKQTKTSMNKQTLIDLI